MSKGSEIYHLYSVYTSFPIFYFQSKILQMRTQISANLFFQYKTIKSVLKVEVENVTSSLRKAILSFFL